MYVIVLAGLSVSVFAVLFFSGNLGKEISPVNSIKSIHTNTSNELGQTRYSFPIRLKIPTINLDTSIESVGITSEGVMESPKNSDEVGWFNLGPRPGEIGNSVIAGHSGYKVKNAAFDDLDKISVGDRLYVENDKGETISFKVRKIAIYEADADATEVFKSKDGVHLNLITCIGSWDKLKKSYSHRLVVFADLVD